MFKKGLSIKLKKYNQLLVFTSVFSSGYRKVQRFHFTATH